MLWADQSTQYLVGILPFRAGYRDCHAEQWNILTECPTMWKNYPGLAAPSFIARKGIVQNFLVSCHFRLFSYLTRIKILFGSVVVSVLRKVVSGKEVLER